MLNPENRPTAKELLDYKFIKNSTGNQNKFKIYLQDLSEKGLITKEF